MRVTMYTEDYDPLAVIEAADPQIEWLRRNPGHEVQFAESRMSDYRRYRADALVSSVADVYRGRIVVEGMEWMDGVTRPILVVKGRSLCEALLSEPGRVASSAHSLFMGAVNGMRGTDVTNDRRRFVASHPPLYEGTIHGDTLISGGLNLGQRAVETAAARLARDIDNEVLRNMAVINPGRMFRGSPLYQDYPPAEGALGLAGAVTSAAVAQTGGVNTTPRLTVEDMERAVEAMNAAPRVFGR
jgi:hypothetical protein